jgi:hypothetical protein
MLDLVGPKARARGHPTLARPKGGTFGFRCSRLGFS